MNKVAIFVEGLTEQIFVEQLLTEIAGEANISIKKCKLTGGKKGPRTRLCFRHNVDDREYFAHIIDSSNDSTVKSDIVDNYDSLVANGYTSIIGIRDVYPLDRSELPLLKRGLAYKVKTKPLSPVFVIPVMETEAWFLAEHSHFKRIHPGLTINRIKSTLNFDPSVDSTELRDHPANDLNVIYALEGVVYNKNNRKRQSEIKRTVNALDFNEIYFTLSGKISSLKELILEIDRFLHQTN